MAARAKTTGAVASDNNTGGTIAGGAIESGGIAGGAIVEAICVRLGRDRHRLMPRDPQRRATFWQLRGRSHLTAL